MLKALIMKLRAMPKRFSRKLGPAKPSRLPERGQEISWMRDMVAFYRAAQPNEAHLLFRRGSALYMPAILARVAGFRHEHLAAYRELQRSNADLVVRARQRHEPQVRLQRDEGAHQAIAA
jgi:hypothetical protein